MKQARQLCKEMIIGLILWLIPVLLILTIIAPNHLAMAAGVLTGGAVAAGLLWHMYRHLDIALDMDAKHAQSHTQLAAFKRMFFVGVIMAAALVLPQYVHPIGVVFGIMGHLCIRSFILLFKSTGKRDCSDTLFVSSQYICVSQKK